MSGSGTPILAADFNQIQSIAQNLLGVGSGQYGYGQTVLSIPEVPGSAIDLANWVNLRTDLLKIGTHQTGSASEGDLLVIPGSLSPVSVQGFSSKTGTGPYYVTLQIPTQATAPSVGAAYKIIGNSTVVVNGGNVTYTPTLYNGVVYSTSSTNSTITLKYNSDPGSWSTAAPTMITSVLTETLRAQYLSYAQSVYINAYNPTIVVTGSITNGTAVLTCGAAAVIMQGATITDSTGNNSIIPANTLVNNVSVGQSLTLSRAAVSGASNVQFTLTLPTGTKAVASNQLTPNQSLASIQRTIAWNGDIQSTATISFVTSNAARAFFNAGSQIEVSALLNGTFSSGSTLKDQTWATMFTQMGIVAIRANDTINVVTDYSGTPSVAYPIGWFGLTQFDRLIFTKSAPSGSYSANVFNIFARTDASGTALILTIRFQDDSGNPNPPTGIDENVDGTLTCSITTTRASGTNVSTPAPLVSMTAIA